MITYEIARSFDVEKIIEVFESSGIVRPTKEKERIKSMFENANLIYFAYDNGELIGLARCVTDFSYCCYLSDLAVKKDYQKQGIGKKTRRKGERAYRRKSIVSTAFSKFCYELLS